MTGLYGEVLGGTDDDVLDLTAVSVPLRIVADEGDDQVIGGSEADMIYGGPGIDLLDGGPGDDLIVAGPGIGQTLWGGPGDDRIFGSNDGSESDPDFNDATYFGDVIDGGPGNDRIWGLGGADLIRGGDDDDFIDGGPANDLIFGGSGNDEIWAGVSLLDVLHGEAGDDIIIGSHIGADTITGGAGNDYIRGQGGNDTIDGGDDHDLIDGGPGTDDLRGGEGDDEILGGGGAGDILRGEAGDDLLRGSDDGADVILGGPGRDRVFGGGGNDTIDGGTGDDILDGGAGDDTISGGAGSDLLLGGADHDVIYAANLDGSADDGSVDYAYGDFGTHGNEPGSGRDQIFGDSGIDLLFGEAEDDLIDDDAAVPGIPDPTTTIDIVEYDGGEAVDPTTFVAPTPTPNPPVDAPGNGIIRGTATLPAGINDRGRWAELAGSASNSGLSGDDGLSLSPSIAVTSDGPVVAWSDTRNGSLQVYVAQETSTGWQELADSAGLGGVSDSLGASIDPSISVDNADRPIVAWIESHGGGDDVYAAVFDATAGGGNGAWVALGSSLTGGGISNTGVAEQVQMINTSFGPVVVWLNQVSGHRQVYARVFTGGTWQPLAGSASGNGISNAPTGADITDLTVAERTGRIAVAWSQLDAGTDIRQIHMREYDGAAWTEIAGSATGGGVSGGLGTSFEGVQTHNAQPTVAYYGGNLFVAWQMYADHGSALIAVEYDGSPEQPIERAAIAAIGLPVQPRLVTGGGELQLVWAHHELDNLPSRVYARRWDGAQFVEEILGDSQDLGISFTSNLVQSLSATIDSSGSAAVAWEDASGSTPEIFVRQNRLDISGTVYVADPAGSTVQQILDANDLGSGDVILVSGRLPQGFTVTLDDAGVTIIGAPGSRLIGDVQITADDVTFQRLLVYGDVTATSADRFALRESTIVGVLTVDGGADVQLSHNTIHATSPGIVLVGDTDAADVRNNTVLGGGQGIALGDPDSVLVGGALDVSLHDNQVSGSATGLIIATASSGEIFDNDFSATGTGLDVDASFLERSMTTPSAMPAWACDTTCERTCSRTTFMGTRPVSSPRSTRTSTAWAMFRTPNRIAFSAT